MRSIPRRERRAEPAAESDCWEVSPQVPYRKGQTRTYALHAVTALHGPGAAAAGTGVVGGREDGEGEGGEDGEAGEHGRE